jgi:phospho-N-acetylmuramoyl-pentapeptide-transferase
VIVFWSGLLALLSVGAFVQLAKRYGWGKSIRSQGPRSHLSKEGTPTMGGIAFLLAALLVWLLFGDKSADLWAVACLILAAALLGWYDDLMAILARRRTVNSDAAPGLLARYRLLLQTAIALAFALYATRAGHSLFGIDWLDTLAYALIIVGAINAMNFSDGLDGLAAGLMAIMLLLFLPFSLAGALLGGLLGFLWYNAPPARVFMGGVGSEALGAALAGLAIISGWVWWLPLIALVPVLEVLSVMVQVVYFRLTGGSRLLKMSPLHHHFELSGWSEEQVIFRFWLLTAVCVAIAWYWGGRG